MANAQPLRDLEPHLDHLRDAAVFFCDLWEEFSSPGTQRPYPAFSFATAILALLDSLGEAGETVAKMLHDYGMFGPEAALRAALKDYTAALPLNSPMRNDLLHPAKRLLGTSPMSVSSTASVQTGRVVLFREGGTGQERSRSTTEAKEATSALHIATIAALRAAIGQVEAKP